MAKVALSEKSYEVARVGKVQAIKGWLLGLGCHCEHEHYKIEEILEVNGDPDFDEDHDYWGAMAEELASQ